jgi:glycosyltransferase involved in cell wall biosynthesis
MNVQKTPGDEIQRSVTLVGFRKLNWASHSGMNRLMDFMPMEQIQVRRRLPMILQLFFWPVIRYVSRPSNNWYDFESSFLELMVAASWLKKKGHVFHFLSAENEFLWSASLKKASPKNKIVCTYHSPVAEYVRMVLNHEPIRQVDAAVVVGSNQVDFFSSLLSPERVWHIPHGVDTDFWAPSAVSREDGRRHILFVGAHLRDYETLRGVISAFDRREKEIVFDVVLQKSDAVSLVGLKNVNIFSNVKDEELLRLYRQSALLICPVVEMTASNSILEAMGCSLPVVVSDAGAIRDYVTPECALLTVPKSVDSMVDAVTMLLNDDTLRKTMGEAGRKRALELDWRVIVEEYYKVYRAVLE